jgi:hypothetical protein
MSWSLALVAALVHIYNGFHFALQWLGSVILEEDSEGTTMSTWPSFRFSVNSDFLMLGLLL